MKQRDQNRLTMWRALEQFLDTRPALWSKNLPFSEAAQELRENITKAKAAMGVQGGRSTGISSERAHRCKDAIEKILAIASCCKAYALKSGDRMLLDTLSYSKSHLTHLPQNELSARLRSILSAVEAVADRLTDYGINSQTIGEADKAINLLEVRQSSVRLSIKGKKAVTASISEIMAAGQLALTQMDCLIHLFEAEDPESVASYRMITGVVHAGKRRHEGSDEAAA